MQRLYVIFEGKDSVIIYFTCRIKTGTWRNADYDEKDEERHVYNRESRCLQKSWVRNIHHIWGSQSKSYSSACIVLYIVVLQFLDFFKTLNSQVLGNIFFTGKHNINVVGISQV